MAEQKSLIVHVARQTLTTPAKPTASLIGRGLAAIRDGGALAKSQDQEALYRKARDIYECYVDDWEQSEHAAELTEAFTIFQRLASEGYGKAYYPISRFFSGMIGMGEFEESVELLEHFTALAFKWCFDNQFQDDPAIWDDLGELYSSCLIGEKSNAELAYYWYEKAAEQGHAHAQFHLGLCYESGRGVEQNDTKAVYWCEKAAGQGDAYAQEYLWLGKEIDRLKTTKSNK